MISKSVKVIVKDKELVTKLSELVKKAKYSQHYIPQDQNYLNLLSSSLQNILKAK